MVAKWLLHVAAGSTPFPEDSRMLGFVVWELRRQVLVLVEPEQLVVTVGIETFGVPAHASKPDQHVATFGLRPIMQYRRIPAPVFTFSHDDIM